MLSTFERVIIEKKRCCIAVFQPSVVFHIETADFKLDSSKMSVYTVLQMAKG